MPRVQMEGQIQILVQGLCSVSKQRHPVNRQSQMCKWLTDIRDLLMTGEC